MTLSPILSIFFFSISQLSTFIFCSSSSLRLISHKTNPGVAAVVAASKQKEEEELMDEWAPYRMAFLLILVASSVALWASYKLLWYFLTFLFLRNFGFSPLEFHTPYNSKNFFLKILGNHWSWEKISKQFNLFVDAPSILKKIFLKSFEWLLSMSLSS
ncbi:unnamed protein product [Meloidogyne enterolobii]|uniref:Uncharacterized protein n=1 Tax=Meloidogyne enterolobii TaxID=390850 RepID=A0ACB1A2C4_MELEN